MNSPGFTADPVKLFRYSQKLQLVYERAQAQDQLHASHEPAQLGSTRICSLSACCICG